ncbi:MAG: choice-of-anchor tandem repeat NxxGxxAF-containing protein [Planctomycetota bacterium]
MLNDVGQVAFYARIEGPGVTSNNHDTIYTGNSAGTRLVAREGSAAPDSGGGVFFGLIQPGHLSLNNQNDIAFIGGATVLNGNGIWREDGATQILSGAYLEGETVPGSDPADDETFSSFGTNNISLSSDGDVSFNASSTENGITNWSERGGSLQRIISQDDPAPDLVDITIDRINNRTEIIYNDEGHAAFTVSLTGTGVDSSNDAALYAETSSGVELIAREGDAAPGAGVGLLFGNSFVDGSPSGARPAINGSDELLFYNNLTGPGVTGTNDASLWSTVGGGLELVARAGDQAPDRPAGQVFFDIANGNKRYAINDDGTIVFESGLSGPGVTSTSDRGIWATDDNGDLFLVIAEGQTIDIDPDAITTDLRTVSTFDFNDLNEGTAGRSQLFNNNDELLLPITFTDGTSGLFVVDLSPAPIVVIGDGNCDGVVDLLDFDILAANFGNNVTGGVKDADFNGDGVVDLLDFDILAFAFAAAGSAQVVPEPGIAAMLSLGLLAFRRRRG